jgi:hypothetical protein
LLQNAPLTEHQQNAIISLSHAVSERPLPLKLVSYFYFAATVIVLIELLFMFMIMNFKAQENASVQHNALSVTTEDSSFDDSGAIKTVMVNTNQVSCLRILICGF